MPGKTIPEKSKIDPRIEDIGPFPTQRRIGRARDPALRDMIRIVAICLGNKIGGPVADVAVAPIGKAEFQCGRPSVGGVTPTGVDGMTDPRGPERSPAPASRHSDK